MIMKKATRKSHACFSVDTKSPGGGGDSLHEGWPVGASVGGNCFDWVNCSGKICPLWAAPSPRFGSWAVLRMD